MNISDALALDYRNWTQEDVFNMCKWEDRWDRCLDEVDRWCNVKLQTLRIPVDIEDSIRDHPDLVDELRQIWQDTWGEDINEPV